MKNSLLTLLALFVLSNAIGQDKTRYTVPTATTGGVINNVENSCGYNNNLANKEIKISLGSEREVGIIKKILSYTGLPLNFQIFSANISNAGALIVDEDRIILYDPTLLQVIDNSSKTYWTSISILAHEIGHHLSGHTLKAGTNHFQKELEADKFSGFVLYKMGATLENSIAAITLFGDNIDTRTHPSKDKRVIAIESGWNEAAAYRFEGAVPPPPANDFPDLYALYTPEMFYKEKNFKKNEFYQNHKDEIEDPTIYEGVLLEVNEKYDGHPSSETVTAIQVLVQKVLKLNKRTKELGYNSDFEPDEKVWIVYNYPTFTHCSMAQFRAFEGLLVPGRKIQFSALWEGGNSVGYYQLNHIRALKR